MKYILLIYHNEASRKAIEADFESIAGEVDTIIQELTATGEWVGGDGLGVEAKSVRVRNGVPAITDGPWARWRGATGTSTSAKMPCRRRSSRRRSSGRPKAFPRVRGDG
jgi:hypothetical protein